MDRSFYRGVERDDVDVFQRFAWVLMRLGVVEYMAINVWEERVVDPYFGDEFDIEYKIDHVSVSVIVSGDELGDYDIR